ncbi:MAG: UDP-N-acetylmuramoyl-tripeptide--D-alanyl-D-alanine ligase [Candidatus Doudnabacteria bacterium]|nr:UDP-N-acetylmuramoyl-tripeptide--D-alanyl-D-alanine ligase [Candidatus Doudnabacteria bacterium]
MRIVLKTILAILARLTLLRYKPKIVGITGSVGKTSAKEAVSLVLSSRYRVRSSYENYNNEIGLPLSIIGEYSAGKNFFAWLLIVLKALLKLFTFRYPQILVLEMGSDRSGDIEYLVSVVSKLDAVVLTDIGISHLEFFASASALAKEKLSITKGLSKEGVAIANFDNDRIRENLNMDKYRVISYGFGPNCLVVATDFHLLNEHSVWGLNFKVHHAGTVVPFFLPNALGKPSVYASLAAAAVGLHFGINLVDASESLSKLTPLAGRLRFLAGIKHTSIIDDSYNAAPSSTLVALETLAAIAPGRKIVALGDMAELGRAGEEGHKLVAAKILELSVNTVFLIGEQVKIIQDELASKKFNGQVFLFENADDARIPIQNFLLPNDTILIKGSQAARMEKIVKETMADPLKAEELLVRQSKKWLEKP